MAKTLGDVDRELKDSERRRIESSAQLMQRIASLDTAGQDLRSQTGKLVDALKRPAGRGRWGELQLKRVIELSGMIQHCDFEEQHTVTDADDRRMRPDVVVRLAGGKHVVIDAKAPLDAYLRALEAPDEPTRQALLCEHAKQVRTHLTQLSAKGYAAHIHPSPDFVVMFLPGEMFFSAALEQDPSLIEFGVEQHVIPASPTTLIALLRAVAYGWQQEAMEENARKISDLGRQLYDAVGKLGAHFDNLGTKLKGSLEAYNSAVGSLEGNVLVKARKFKELQAASAVDDIPALEPVDRVPRMLQARELTDGLPFPRWQPKRSSADRCSRPCRSSPCATRRRSFVTPSSRSPLRGVRSRRRRCPRHAAAMGLDARGAGICRPPRHLDRQSADPPRTSADVEASGAGAGRARVAGVRSANSRRVCSSSPRISVCACRRSACATSAGAGAHVRRLDTSA